MLRSMTYPDPLESASDTRPYLSGLSSISAKLTAAERAALVNWFAIKPDRLIDPKHWAWLSLNVSHRYYCCLPAKYRRIHVI